MQQLKVCAITAGPSCPGVCHHTLLGLFGDRLRTSVSQKMAIAHGKQSPSYAEMQTQLTEPRLKDWAEYRERCTRVPGQMEVIRGPKGLAIPLRNTNPPSLCLLPFLSFLYVKSKHTLTEHYKTMLGMVTHTFSPTVWEVGGSGLHDQPQSCETPVSKNQTHKTLGTRQRQEIFVRSRSTLSTT